MRKMVHAFWALCLALITLSANVRADDAVLAPDAPPPAAAATPTTKSSAKPGKPASVVIYGRDGKPLPDKIWSERGKPTLLYARAFDTKGNMLSTPVTWVVDPAPVATVTPQASGWTYLVTQRDLFDDPNGFEPWTNIRACAGSVCRWVFVTSVISLAGNWHVEIDVQDTFMGWGDEERDMVFAQDGRTLRATFVGKGAGGKPMVATIRGKIIEFQDPNRELTMFTGRVTGRQKASGTWKSSSDHNGEWHAKRKK